MARDHRRLRVFHEAHSLTAAIYKETRTFPRDEWYGIRAQIRRAAVSVAANLVEGNARCSTPEYVNFLNIARGSAGELGYLVLLASELGYLSPAASRHLGDACNRLIPQLEALLQTMELKMNAEREHRTSGTKDQRLKTKD
jgi:four helix bundle protein